MKKKSTQKQVGNSVDYAPPKTQALPAPKQPDQGQSLKQPPSQSSTPVIDASESPGIFELALLAEVLTLRNNQILAPAAAVAEALEFWRAAGKATIANTQWTQLLEGIFTIPEAEWTALLQNYAGDPKYLNDMLTGRREGAPRFDLENQVLPKLFIAKSETRETYLKKLDELLEFASAQGRNIMALLIGDEFRYSVKAFTAGDKNTPLQSTMRITSAEVLLRMRLNVVQLRWLVEARMEQLSKVKVRPRRSKGASAVL